MWCVCTFTYCIVNRILFRNKVYNAMILNLDNYLWLFEKKIRTDPNMYYVEIRKDIPFVFKIERHSFNDLFLK